MASLQFKGKVAVWNHHLSVPYHTLEKDVKKSLKGADDAKNLIIEGDNLLALKALLPQYQGRVKCIYIDPPYNTGSEKWVYSDNVNSPTIKDWVGRVVGVEGEDLTRHDKWLAMMTPRLKLLRDLLSEDGAIYVQLDYNEAHYCKALMDEIFGRENFQREIIWRIGWVSGFKSADDNWIRNHDTILFYSKDAEKLAFNKQYNTQKDYLERFNGEAAKELAAYFQGIGLDKKTSNAAIDFASKAGLPERYPLEDTWNSTIYDKLNSIAIVSFSGEKVSKLLGAEEFKGQKSVQLIKRIIKAHTSENDIVLDSFAGTGTTAHAVMELNKEDGGNRKFILVEMEDYANKLTAERVRTVIKNAKGKTGFTYETLGPAIDADELLQGKLPKFNEFAKYVYYLATGKNHPDEKKIDEKSGFVGKAESESIWLLYKANMDALKTLAITLDWAQEAHKKDKGRKVVYAPACYLDDETLDQYNIKFVSIPYNLFERQS